MINDVNDDVDDGDLDDDDDDNDDDDDEIEGDGLAQFEIAILAQCNPASLCRRRCIQLMIGPSNHSFLLS